MPAPVLAGLPCVRNSYQQVLTGMQDVLNEVIEHLGLSDFLEVTQKATPTTAFEAGDRHVGVRRGRFASKPSEWPPSKMWTVPLGANDGMQVMYTQQWLQGAATRTPLCGFDEACVVEQVEQAGAAHVAAGVTGDSSTVATPSATDSAVVEQAETVAGGVAEKGWPGKGRTPPVKGSEGGDCKFM